LILQGDLLFMRPQDLVLLLGLSYLEKEKNLLCFLRILPLLL